MVSRERLRHVAALGVRLANERRLRIAAQLLLAAGLVFVALRLSSIWHDSHISVAHIGWGWLAGSLILAICSVFASALIWLEILRSLGTSPRPSWAAVYLQGQLGKYVPGSLWQYASRGALASRQGIPVRLVARSLPIELAAVAFAGSTLATLLLGWRGLIALVAVMGVAQMATASRRVPHWPRIAARTAALYAGTWLLIGPSFWMTARALVHVPPGQLAFYTGAFATAWIVGLLAIYAPGGIGVREALLVALLRSHLGTPDAVLVAAASRLVFTLADLVPACLSVPLFRLLPPPAPEPAADA